MSPVSFLRTTADVRIGTTEGEANVCASCGSAAAEESGCRSDTYANPLSLDALLIRHPSATYFVRVGLRDDVVISENAYLGVRVGDILMIDRSLTPTVGSLVLAVSGGELMLCRYTEHEGKRFLVCGTRDAASIELMSDGGTDVWGVVAALSRRL